jgi:hypothetical protein
MQVAQAEERQHTARVNGRAREQNITLNGLGLNELEAVDYVLQLSRDEEEARRVAALEFGDEVVGELELEFGDALATPVFEHTRPLGAGDSWTASGTRHLPARPGADSNARRRSPPSDAGSSVHGYTPSRSAPLLVPRTPREPRAAGFEADHTPVTPPTMDTAATSFGAVDFPPVSRTPSSTGVSAPGTPARRTMSASPEWARLHTHSVSSAGTGTGSPAGSSRSAWSTPLRTRAPPLAHTRSEPLVVGSPSPPRTHASVEEADEDEDLRFAIELSLAEARSRGEEV